MKPIARVVVDIALDREFDYQVPARLAGTVRVGSRVEVPFGRRLTRGYVVGLRERSAHAGLREIDALCGDKPLIDESVLKLARWIGEYYCTPVENAIRTVLPGAVRRRPSGFKKRMHVRLSGGHSPQERAAALARSPAQAAALRTLEEHGEMLLSDLTRAAGISAAPVKGLEARGFVELVSARVQRDPIKNRRLVPTEALVLMAEQEQALVRINAAFDSPEPSVVLLHGVTGSGKTEVYLQAIAHALEQGRGAIVLVPEISLTPQTVERFDSRFGSRIAVLHSHLSEGERHDEWHRVRDGKADIVIGARSAVFAPVANLGLIVVDEEHEPSYKQEEAPRYNARDVAVMRGRMQGCTVVLGSATPSLESWFNAGSGKYELATLSRRVDDRRMPVMRVVDMRAEAARTGRMHVLSAQLVEAIRQRIERAEQTIIFLNRRGYATSLVCHRCGHVAACTHCSVSYTYHRQIDELRCHLCGAARRVPARCPECADPAFKYSGFGTQRVESIIRKCFPNAAVERLDADITTRRDAYDRILGDFRVGRTDILVGTQMIAKGLHFPNVTLVGVVYADLSLHIPDFRAGERTFQLLAQVAGRAGRGDVAGEVIVQTYTPFNSAIQAARRLDYEGFCDQEIEFRRELGYPPFTHLVCLTLRAAQEELAARAAADLGAALESVLPANVIQSPPVPAPLARVRGAYRYHVILRCPTIRRAAAAVRRTVADHKFPRGVTCTIDVDALSLR